MALWEAWKLSKAYSRTPSELYCVRDELAAWSFNRAVFLFGTTVEGELSEAADGAKNKFQMRTRQQRVLARYGLGEMKFRDPAGGAGQPSQAADAAGAEVHSETSGPVKL